MSKTIKFLSAFFLMLIVGISLLLIDDKINPEFQEMYENATAHKQSEAFAYLLGIQSAADEDPHIVGNELLKAIKTADEKFFKGIQGYDNYLFENYPDNKKLAQFQLNDCNSKQSESECSYVEKLFAHQFEENSLNKSQKVLLKRFNEFLLKDDFHSITEPHAYTPIPPFQYLMQANDLNNLLLIDKFRNKDIERALSQYINTFKLLRNHLQQADTLIAKIIYSEALSRNIDVLSVLRNQNNNFKIDELSPLSKAERSLSKAMNYEFGMIYNLSKMMGNDSRFLSQEANSIGRLNRMPNGLVRLFFKPNMTINTVGNRYKRVADVSHLSTVEFSSVTSEKGMIEADQSYIRNYIGTILTNVSNADFYQYVSRLFALDAKIALFNATAKKSVDSIKVKDIKNPFFSDTLSAYFSEGKQSICFEIPRVETQDHKCLLLSL